MNPLNKKIAFGVAGATATALAAGGIANAISDHSLEKDRQRTIKNIRGDSKEARRQRIQVNKDFNKEEKSIDHTIELATAGAIAVSGLSGVGIAKIAKTL